MGKSALVRMFSLLTALALALQAIGPRSISAAPLQQAASSVQVIDHGWNIICAHIDDAVDPSNVAVTIKNGGCDSSVGGHIVGSLWWQFQFPPGDPSEATHFSPNGNLYATFGLINPGGEEHVKLVFDRFLPAGQTKPVTLTYTYGTPAAGLLNLLDLFAFLSNSDLKDLAPLSGDDIQVVEALLTQGDLLDAINATIHMVNDSAHGDTQAAVQDGVGLVTALMKVLTKGYNKPLRKKLFNLVTKLAGKDAAILSGNALHWVKGLLHLLDLKDLTRKVVEAWAVNLTSLRTNGSMPSLGFVYTGSYQPPTPTPTTSPTSVPTPHPAVYHCPPESLAPVRGCYAIFTDKPQYNVGDTLQFCYSVPGPSHVRITDITPDGNRKVVLDSDDDGTGGCSTGTVTPPTGQECLQLQVSYNGTNYQDQACFQVVSGTTQCGKQLGQQCTNIWIDYSPDRSIHVCYSVPQPSFVRITVFDDDTATSVVVFESNDDGSGDCPQSAMDNLVAAVRDGRFPQLQSYHPYRFHLNVYLGSERIGQADATLFVT